MRWKIIRPITEVILLCRDLAATPSLRSWGILQDMYRCTLVFLLVLVREAS